MARIVNGTLTVTSFQPTANVSEFYAEGCTFVNQADATGNGAYDLAVGFIVYVTVVDPNSLELVPGIVNRYVVTDITIVDQDTVNITILYNHDEPQTDVPADYSVCMISQPTPNHKFGLPISPFVYPALTLGMDTAALATDIDEVTDLIQSGSTQPNTKFLFTQAVPSAEWVVNHTMNSVNFNYTLFDGNGMLVFPDWIEVVDFNTLKVHLLEPMTGKLALTFV